MLVNVRHRQLFVRHVAASSDAVEFPDCTIFFVHGAMASMENFRLQFPAFDHRFAHTVAYDYYGCGKSPRLLDSRESYSTDEHLEDLAFLFHQYKSKRNILVGHSFGTNQLLRLAGHTSMINNNEIAGLVLLAPPTSSPTLRDGGHWIFRLPEWVLRAIQPQLSASFAERAFHAVTRDGKTEEHVALLAYAQQRSNTNDMHVCKSFYNQIKFIKREDVVERVPARVRCAVVCGSADLLTPLDMAAQLKLWLDARQGGEATTAEVHVIDPAAHQLMEEQPARVNVLILAFCKQVLE